MIEIKMPRLSDTMEEGAISTWRKHPGDSVAVGDVLVEIETDKAVMEYEAYQSGTLSQILVDEGKVAEIGATIALIDDGTGPANNSNTGEERSPGSPAITDDSARIPARDLAVAGTSPSASNGNGARAAGRIIASPLVRKLAREHNLDLTHVTGTGPGGRIIRADIAGLLAGPEATGGAASAPGRAAPAAPAPAAPASAAPAAVTPAAVTPAAVTPAAVTPAAAAPAAAVSAVPAAAESAPADDVRGSRSVPVSQVRRVIARRLSASAREIPHYYVTAAADATDLMELRATLNGQLSEAGRGIAGRGKISVNDLLIRAVALALREHPDVNVSYFGEASTTMLVHDRVNIGVAVAAESGLIVPVILDADTKTVTQIGAEARKLVALAGERKLTPAQVSGGTFTISNLGMHGVEEFTAIINPPEAAILAVGATIREPAVVGDEIVPRYKLRYTLSSDHRVIDGALAAQFLKTLTRLIEHPWMIIA